MVALRVVHQAFGGHGLQLLFQFVEILCAPDLGLVGHAKYKIAKTEVVGQDPAQVFQQRRRALAKKRVALGISSRTKFRAAGLQHHWHVGHQTLDQTRQFETRVWAKLSIPRELHVRNNSEKIFAILLHHSRRIFKIRAQQNLGPRLHAHQLVCHVDAFLNHAPRLLDQLGIDDRQKRRVVADVVFDDQQHGHADGARIVQHVAFVFDVLDDGDQDARIALPQEHALNIGQRIARYEILDLAIVVSQNDHGNVESRAADFARQLGGVHVSHRKVGHDQIELRITTGQVKRFGATGNVRDPRDVLQAQFERFVNEQFVEASIFAQDERIVEARDQKNILHLEGHQVLEAFKALFRVENRLGRGAEGHGVANG